MAGIKMNKKPLSIGNCGNCMYSFDLEFRDNHYYECRFNPPCINGENFYSEWPKVIPKSDWCYKWKGKL